jgi:hypothetical protein
VRLARQFAEEDFFGGFGSEADAPGLGLWAVGEVARRHASSVHDRWLWPHVERKVKLIESMLHARLTLRVPFSGIVAPSARRHPEIDHVAHPAHRGLVEGRMDWHQPVYYVSATSYLGLVEAAELARRLGHVQSAERWTKTAEELQRAYRAAMRAAHASDNAALNARTTTNALYPSDIAEPDQVELILAKQWANERDDSGRFKQYPPWTYFTIAQSHQWLRLGQPDKAWQTLRWYAQEDLVPGMQDIW